MYGLYSFLGCTNNISIYYTIYLWAFTALFEIITEKMTKIFTFLAKCHMFSL